jgi:hypothetical protein
LSVLEIIQINEDIERFLRLERLLQIWSNGMVEYWKVVFKRM